jgi:hypothetical protein
MNGSGALLLHLLLVSVSCCHDRPHVRIATLSSSTVDPWMGWGIRNKQSVQSSIGKGSFHILVHIHSACARWLGISRCTRLGRYQGLIDSCNFYHQWQLYFATIIIIILGVLVTLVKTIAGALTITITEGDYSFQAFLIMRSKYASSSTDALTAA